METSTENIHEKYVRIKDKINKYNLLVSKGWNEKVLTQKHIPTQEEYDFFYNHNPKNKEKEDRFKKNREAYQAKLLTLNEKKEFTKNIEDLKEYFIDHYKHVNQKEFVWNEPGTTLFYTLACYFLRKTNFFNSPILKHQINIGGVIKKTPPSFKKSLCIVGDFGTGKSSVMKAFQSIFKRAQEIQQDVSSMVFIRIYVDELVDAYETKERADYLKLITKPKICIDDIHDEEVASNYGKRDVVRETLRKRYEKNLITHIIKNDKKDHEGDLGMAIYEIGERYGDKVLDRLFETHNIIEVRGKSMRGTQ